MSQVDKTSEDKLVDSSSQTLPHKVFHTALWSLPLNVSGNLDFFIYQREWLACLEKILISVYSALIISPSPPPVFPFQSTISLVSFNNFIHHSLLMN